MNIKTSQQKKKSTKIIQEWKEGQKKKKKKVESQRPVGQQAYQHEYRSSP